MRRWIVAVVAGSLVVGGLAGCDKTSYQCRGQSCEISVSGTPTVTLGPSHSAGDPGPDSPSFTVKGYTADGVRLSAGGETRTARTGRVVVIGDLKVRVVHVSGHGAKLHVDY